ncbi:hypothetical protein HK104_001277 [Borealophlyctis nickersoniae]|nr:hypothetical protein HK104_001277 [Borealophlyctis nickersoniae]
MVPALKLTYFDAKGRAEPIRLALYIGNIAFGDNRITESEWLALKPVTLFGQLPELLVDGKTAIAQSHAILRYAGKLTGLYPWDILEAAQVDMMVDVHEDVSRHLTPSIYEKDPAKKRSLRASLIEPTHPFSTLLRKVDTVIGDIGLHGHTVGNRLTIADLVWYQFVEWVRSGILEGIPKDFLEQFGNLVRVAETVEGNERVREWNKVHGGGDVA